jgi:hypothetical protein
MFFSKSIFATVLLAASALAAPLTPSCSTAKALMTLPAADTKLAKQTGAPSFALLGVGVQNYTCSAAGTFASAGAVAKLYDISCLQGNSIFATIQDKAVGTSDRGLSLIEGALAGTTIFMGDHYFVTNPTGAGGISPEFDFRTGAKKGDANGFVIVKKNLGVAAPNPANVDLLALDALPGFGTLGKHVYRMDTALGQPAKTCTAGATASVKYAAKYYVYA